MEINVDGVDLIKSFEGCRLQAYLDIGNVPTIGYGHTADVQMGTAITQAQADKYLMEDLSEFETYVNDYVKIPITQNQFDALVSFTYNLGPQTFDHSSVLTYTNAGHFNQAANAMLLYDHAGGERVLGLTRRREAERLLYLSPDDATPAPPEAQPPGLFYRILMWFA